MRTLEVQTTKTIIALSFGGDGRTLAAAWPGGFTRLDLTDQSQKSVQVSHSQRLFVFDLDPRGRWLYHSQPGEGCYVYSFANDVRHRLPSFDGDNHVVSLSRSADGSRLTLSRGVIPNNRVESWVVTPNDSFSLAWRFRDGKLTEPDNPRLLDPAIPRSAPFTALLGSVTSLLESWFAHAVAMSPDGQTIALMGRKTDLGSSTSRGQKAELRSAPGGQLLGEAGDFSVESGFRMTFSPDGSALIGYQDRWLNVHSLAGKLLGKLAIKRGQASIQGLALHPSGRWLVTVGNDGCANCLSLPGLELLKKYKWQMGKLHCVAVSPDGMLVAAGCDRGKVLLWDVDV